MVADGEDEEEGMDEVRWLIAQQIPHLRRYALALVRHPETADDLVQDCLERALRKRRLWQRRGSVRNWLFRILYNIFIDHARRAAKERGHVPIHEVGHVGSVPARQELRVACSDIGEALDQLPPQQRAAVILVALEGLSYDEAADALGVPVGTLRSRVSRAREALRETHTSRRRKGMLQRVK